MQSGALTEGHQDVRITGKKGTGRFTERQSIFQGRFVDKATAKTTLDIKYAVETGGHFKVGKSFRVNTIARSRQNPGRGKRTAQFRTYAGAWKRERTAIVSLRRPADTDRRLTVIHWDSKQLSRTNLTRRHCGGTGLGRDFSDQQAQARAIAGSGGAKAQQRAGGPNNFLRGRHDRSGIGGAGTSSAFIFFTGIT